MISATIMIFLFGAIAITTGGNPTGTESYRQFRNHYYMEGDIYTVSPNRKVLASQSLVSPNDHNINHDQSENLNDLKFPRNGKDVSLCPSGLEIGSNGYLYERLAHGHSSFRGLQRNMLLIDCTSPTSRDINFTLLYKPQLTVNYVPGYLDLYASHSITEVIALKRNIIEIPLTKKLGINSSRMVAFKIDGPLIVHEITLMGSRSRSISRPPLLIDNCETWTNPYVEGSRLLYAPLNPFHIMSGCILNINLGGGGETVNFARYPSTPMTNPALRIVYSTISSGKRQVQILQDVWQGNAMRTHVIEEYIPFRKGDFRFLLVHMDDVTHFSGIIVHGPLTVHCVDIVSLMSGVGDKSDYEELEVVGSNF